MKGLESPTIEKQQDTPKNIAESQAGNKPEATEEKNPDEQPIDFEKEMKNLDNELSQNAEALKDKQDAYSDWKGKLDELYSTLGSSAPELRYPEQKMLDKLTERKEKLMEEKQNIQTGKEVETMLGILAIFPPEELKIVIATGKMSNGQEVAGPDGKKLKPEAAKSLALLSFDGAKAVTKIILAVVIGVIGGLASGIYEASGKE